jgi:hypothetical protein
MKGLSIKKFLGICSIALLVLMCTADAAEAQGRRCRRAQRGARISVMQTPSATVIRIPKHRRGGICRPRACSNRMFRSNRRGF